MMIAVFWDVKLCNLMDQPDVSEQPAASIFRVEEARKKLKFELAEIKFVYCRGAPKGGGGGRPESPPQPPKTGNIKNGLLIW
jgi:hypothetical protein